MAGGGVVPGPSQYTGSFFILIPTAPDAANPATPADPATSGTSSDSSSTLGDLGRFLTGNKRGKGLSVPRDLFHRAQALHSVPLHCGVSVSPQFVHCFSPVCVCGENGCLHLSPASPAFTTGERVGGGESGDNSRIGVELVRPGISIRRR